MHCLCFLGVFLCFLGFFDVSYDGDTAAPQARCATHMVSHTQRDLAEESGWKMVHGDVFRPPRHLVLLAGARTSSSFCI